MMQRARKGVPGRLAMNSGKQRKTLTMATRLAARRPAFGSVLSMSHLTRESIGLSFHLNASDIAQHHFARTPPANRHQVADAAADHQTRCAPLMAQVVVRVEDGSWKQA